METTQPKVPAPVVQPASELPSGSRKLRAFAFFLVFLVVLLGAYGVALSGNAEVDAARGSFFHGLAEMALWALGIHNGGNTMEHFAKRRP